MKLGGQKLFAILKKKVSIFSLHYTMIHDECLNVLVCWRPCCNKRSLPFVWYNWTSDEQCLFHWSVYLEMLIFVVSGAVFWDFFTSDQRMDWHNGFHKGMRDHLVLLLDYMIFYSSVQFEVPDFLAALISIHPGPHELLNKVDLTLNRWGRFLLHISCGEAPETTRFLF